MSIDLMSQLDLDDIFPHFFIVYLFVVTECACHCSMCVFVCSRKAAIFCIYSFLKFSSIESIINHWVRTIYADVSSNGGIIYYLNRSVRVNYVQPL